MISEDLKRNRIIAELATAATAEVVAPVPIVRKPDLTVNEVLLAFWEHAQRHYRRADGTPTNELSE